MEGLQTTTPARETRHREVWSPIRAVARALRWGGPLRRFAGAPYRAVLSRVCRVTLGRGLVDTSRRVHLEEYGLAAEGRVEYAPSGWLFARRMFRGVTIGPNDVFVDFGSGMGRMVLMVARRWPFARVIGVELADALTVVARENLRRTNHRLRCQNVDLVTCDATRYRVPDDMTFAYLYNPFMGKVFDEVLANICDSLDRAPRRLTLIYGNPTMGDALIATGRFRLVRSSAGIRRDIRNNRISIYESTDPTPTPPRSPVAG